MHIETDIITESTDISYEENVCIQGLNGDSPFKSKIDTGADVCSLHATDIQTNNQMVTFSVNGRKYTMPVHNMQSVKQADSNAQQRPVIKVTFVIAQQVIPDVECNLNDRSGMSSELLIGRNLLSKHDFVIHTQSQTQDNYSESIELDPIESSQQVDEKQEISEIDTDISDIKVSIQKLMQDLYAIQTKLDTVTDAKKGDK
jgi:hypothetical protein